MWIDCCCYPPSFHHGGFLLMRNKCHEQFGYRSRRHQQECRNEAEVLLEPRKDFLHLGSDNSELNLCTLRGEYACVCLCLLCVHLLLFCTSLNHSSGTYRSDFLKPTVWKQINAPKLLEKVTTCWSETEGKLVNQTCSASWLVSDLMGLHPVWLINFMK